MAARVGSGSLAGVALAIGAGGRGAVFWTRVTAIISMATSFAEYFRLRNSTKKAKDSRSVSRRSRLLYGSQGWGMRWMGVLFSIFLLIAYDLICNTVQANSVAHALRFAFQLSGVADSGGALALLTLLTIVTVAHEGLRA
ncbi:alanine:cation symporter family protein [Klebsiella pneumoniae]|nr:alanine:cation symporter family protein [Klebsiella pneumoniae]